MRNRIEKIRPEFVELIPQQLESGVIYISQKYRTASHLCACGCGEKVVTPFSPADWRLSYKSGNISLHPSIGNWNYNCRSHYWIRNNGVIWAEEMSAACIARVQDRDQADKARQIAQRNLVKQRADYANSEASGPSRRRVSIWKRLWDAVGRFFGGL